ncbi:hypothetical protein BMF94_6136 [Rhodotorula taiwanensis]|uniref:Uncharacterized protein n=1 Tax=Rhodotorula taiwanensis TaxID=741276 RepID=A0A2S5B1T9_9BASI|nr:hypothetical protein BMF94_6136 [Rhodotorula taiwanensis]
MPSLKAVLLSVALSALALAPVAQASPLKAGEALARRSSPTFYSNEAAVDKRSESRKELTARVKRAKLAAARKAKRATRMTFAQQVAAQKAAAAAAAAAAAPSSSAGDSSGAYAPGSPFLSTPQALAAASRRCGVSRTCETTTTPPANANAICLSGRCTFRCQSGFAPGGAAGTECVQGSTSCGPNACNAPTNGYATCAGETCVYGCNAGLTLGTNGGAPVCLNLLGDPANCGTEGAVCPGSYNGVGTAACLFGTCGLRCPQGSYQRRTQDGSANYCYGL